jgi:hypothetical protein
MGWGIKLCSGRVEIIMAACAAAALSGERERERVRPAGKKSESVALGYRTPRIYVRIELMLMPVELQRG